MPEDTYISEVNAAEWQRIVRHGGDKYYFICDACLIRDITRFVRSDQLPDTGCRFWELAVRDRLRHRGADIAA